METRSSRPSSYYKPRAEHGGKHQQLSTHVAKLVCLLAQAGVGGGLGRLEGIPAVAENGTTRGIPLPGRQDGRLGCDGELVWRRARAPERRGTHMDRWRWMGVGRTGDS